MLSLSGCAAGIAVMPGCAAQALRSTSIGVPRSASRPAVLRLKKVASRCGDTVIGGPKSGLRVSLALGGGADGIPDTFGTA